MKNYTAITIIYNPNSTGSSERLARDMLAKLRTVLPKQKIELAFTEYAGHAVTLAYQLAKASRHPLVISASGDGGYHEVINGLMHAQQEGAHPVAGLLPAGNANDHFHNLHAADFVQAVVAGEEHCIDLLKITATYNGQPLERFAHSYIGIGLSPKVGHDLNESKSKRFNDVLILLKDVFNFNSVRLKVDGRIRTYDSLIFSNISKMSKILTLAHEAKVDDGKFEVTALYRRSKFRLLSALLRASTTGLVGARQTDKFTFQTLQSTLVQLDGEVTTIDSDSEVAVDLEPSVLRCIV